MVSRVNFSVILFLLREVQDTAIIQCLNARSGAWFYANKDCIMVHAYLRNIWKTPATFIKASPNLSWDRLGLLAKVGRGSRWRSSRPI